MHNREALTPALLWQSMKDFDLWPIYILGLTFQTPMSTPANYLTLSLKGMGFDTFKTNLLVIPSKVLHVVTMLGLTYAGEVFGELTFTALIGQIWALPFLLFLNVFDINSINRWVAWGVMTLLLCYPSGKQFAPFTSCPKNCLTHSHNHSPPPPSLLALPKQQQRPFPHRLRSPLQHVRPNLRHHSRKHLPRRRRASLSPWKSHSPHPGRRQCILVSGNEMVLCKEE